MSKYTTLIKEYCIAVDRENEQIVKNNKVIYEYNIIEQEVNRLLEINCDTKLTHNARRVKLLVLSNELDLAFNPAIKIQKERHNWAYPKPKPTRIIINKIKEQFVLDELNCETHMNTSELIFLSDNEIINREIYDAAVYAETRRIMSRTKHRDMQYFRASVSDNALRKKYQIFDNPPGLIDELDMSIDYDSKDKKPTVSKYVLIKQ